MSKAGAGPEPPLELELVTLEADATFVRIHQIKDGAIWFGPAPKGRPSYRFDAPAGEYRTLYAAHRLEGAFAETVLRRAQRIIRRDYVELRQWSVIRTLRDVRLVKLFDEGLIRHNVVTDICAGDDYAPSQAFASKLFAHKDRPDGIAYRARHDNGELCYALFDRIEDRHLPIVDARHFANERLITEQLMKRYKASWDPNIPPPPL